MILSMHQPEYMPYLGHIAKIAMSDLHIYYDDVQYEQGGYQNRNRIILGKRWGWITVPVARRFKQKIYDVKINGDRWRQDHAKTILQYYNSHALDEIYDYHWNNLANLNITMTAWMLKELNIHTPIMRSKDLSIKSNDRIDRVIEICMKLKVTTFVSGMGAKIYLNEKKFNDHGIRIIYSDWKDTTTPPLSAIHYLLTEGSQSVKKRITRHINQIA